MIVGGSRVRAAPNQEFGCFQITVEDSPVKRRGPIAPGRRHIDIPAQQVSNGLAVSVLDRLQEVE